MIDGIRFRVRTGVPWQDVPVECGPWGRVHGLFHRRAVPRGYEQPSFSRPVSEWR
ncbi:transposase [Streptomyces sp. NPDC048511]|uniref:transposase n=1 Tax=Streptomyces sp. NPDC048511 TaxID=3365562 RepID=UPI0037207AFD